VATKRCQDNFLDVRVATEVSVSAVAEQLIPPTEVAGEVRIATAFSHSPRFTTRK